MPRRRRLARLLLPLPASVTASFLVVALLGMAPATTFAKDSDHLGVGDISGPYVAGGMHGSILTDAADRALLAGTFGYALWSGWRWDNLGVFVHVEHNLWLATEQSLTVDSGAVNVGLGVEYLYADGFCRTSLSMGPSILAFDTTLDDAGSTEVYFELRPVGLRWSVHRNFVLAVDPISFALVMPVLGGIPIVEPQYRTTLSVEGLFE